MNKKPPFIKSLLHNGGWKLASFIIAAIIWFIVTNYNDPVTSVSFYNIPVTLTNTEMLSEDGKVFEIVDNTDTIPKVTITASRSIAESFTRDDISATADVKELTSRDLVPIHITLKKNQSEVQNVAKSVDDVRLEIEDSKQRTISLQVNTKGVLADNYIVGDTSASQNLVRISGAASRVDNVAKAVAEVDVTGFTSEIATVTDIKLLNENGDVIRDSGITQNITTVNVKVSILETKSVPLKVEYKGVPAGGFMVTPNIVIAPASALIAGTKEALGAVYEITLKGDEFDIEGRKEDLEVNVNLKGFLPTGIRLADEDTNGLVSVSIGIDAASARELTLPWSQITLTDMPEGANYVLDETPTEGVLIRITGLKQTLDGLDVTRITASVNVKAVLGDFGDNPPQTVAAPLTLMLPQGVLADGTVQVTLKQNSEP